MRLQFEGSDEQQDAAFAALAALGAYNRGSKLSQLHELVRRLIDGQAKVCAFLEYPSHVRVAIFRNWFHPAFFYAVLGRLLAPAYLS